MTTNPESGTITLDELLLIQAAVEKVTRERDELRAEVDRIAQTRDHALSEVGRLGKERDELRAEVERLRAALEKIANTEANIHCSWLIADARRTLGNAKEC